LRPSFPRKAVAEKAPPGIRLLPAGKKMATVGNHKHGIESCAILPLPFEKDEEML